jgi:hypothetical protein
MPARHIIPGGKRTHRLGCCWQSAGCDQHRDIIPPTASGLSGADVEDTSSGCCGSRDGISHNKVGHWAWDGSIWNHSSVTGMVGQPCNSAGEQQGQTRLLRRTLVHTQVPLQNGVVGFVDVVHLSRGWVGGPNVVAIGAMLIIWRCDGKIQRCGVHKVPAHEARGLGPCKALLESEANVHRGQQL